MLFPGYAIDTHLRSPGIIDPAVIDRLTAAGIGVQLAPAADPVVRAGWEDQEQLEAFRSVRIRPR